MLRSALVCAVGLAALPQIVCVRLQHLTPYSEHVSIALDDLPLGTSNLLHQQQISTAQDRKPAVSDYSPANYLAELQTLFGPQLRRTRQCWFFSLDPTTQRWNLERDNSETRPGDPDLITEYASRGQHNLLFPAQFLCLSSQKISGLVSVTPILQRFLDALPREVYQNELQRYQDWAVNFEAKNEFSPIKGKQGYKRHFETMWLTFEPEEDISLTVEYELGEAVLKAVDAAIENGLSSTVEKWPVLGERGKTYFFAFDTRNSHRVLRSHELVSAVHKQMTRLGLGFLSAVARYPDRASGKSREGEGKGKGKGKMEVFGFVFSQAKATEELFGEINDAGKRNEGEEFVFVDLNPDLRISDTESDVEWEIDGDLVNKR